MKNYLSCEMELQLELVINQELFDKNIISEDIYRFFLEKNYFLLNKARKNGIL